MTEEEWDTFHETWDDHVGCEGCPLLFNGVENDEEWEECFLLTIRDFEYTSFSEICCRISMARNHTSPTTIKGDDENGM